MRGILVVPLWPVLSVPGGEQGGAYGVGPLINGRCLPAGCDLSWFGRSLAGGFVALRPSLPWSFDGVAKEPDTTAWHVRAVKQFPAGVEGQPPRSPDFRLKARGKIGLLARVFMRSGHP
jgi:hypothetical protein